MPRHSNFADILRLSNQICADGTAWKRNFFSRQQRTLDSPYIFSLGNGCGPEKNQNLSQFRDHFHHTNASRILAVSRFQWAWADFPRIPNALQSRSQSLRYPHPAERQPQTELVPVGSGFILPACNPCMRFHDEMAILWYPPSYQNSELVEFWIQKWFARPSPLAAIHGRAQCASNQIKYFIYTRDTKELLSAR